MREQKSYFATEDDFSFFGDGTLSKLLINFDCLFKGEWNGKKTILENDVIEVFQELRALKYGLYLYEVPFKQEILEWLDSTFDYPFICNDYPTRYADLCDHWTTISRTIKTSLCPEETQNYNRDINFSGSWKEVLKIIKENDVVAQTNSARITYDDNDLEKIKKIEECTDESKYFEIAVNNQTTEFLKTIAKPRSEKPEKYSYKPIKEKYYIESIFWDVNEDICSKYKTKIEIEQSCLFHRGTWISIKMKAPYKSWKELLEIVKKFCKDYSLEKGKELIILDGYELPWKNGEETM